MVGVCVFLQGLSHAGDRRIIAVGEFSRQKLDGWQPKKFVSETSYMLARVDGTFVLKAVSLNSASGLIKKIQVDIDKYPFLNWRWRIENQISGRFDETQKPGDDYAARIYVLTGSRFFFWNIQALNYVWAKNSPKGSVWPNAFAKDNAVMTALRSSGDPVSVWQVEKRNIREDFKTLLGREVRFIDAVVIMSDTDNTQKEVTAYYGDIYFSSR